MHNRVPIAAGLDTFVVVAFVAIGRRSHDENPGIAGLVETATPFVLGLALAWVIARAWNEPWSWRTGLIVWIGTLLAGMALRRFAFDEGTATSFVIVTSVFLGTFLNGWRVVARTMANRHSTTASA
jgi:hypothetical protein